MENFIPTLLSWLSTAGYILLCLFLFGFSIAIHEFGHFIVALKLGYRVERFSIGFGPAIWKRKWHGVEYRISGIPLGGYVSIPDVDPEGTKKLEGGAENGEQGTEKVVMPPWKDLLVAVAGPAMNIVLAVVLAFALSFIPGARFGTSPAHVDGIMEGSPADRGGLMEGDTVVSVGGHQIATWTDMLQEVQFAANRETEFVVKRGDELKTLRLTPEVKENGVAYIGAINLIPRDEVSAVWMPSRSAWEQVKWDAGAVFRALKGLVTPKEMKATGKAVGGPVLIAKQTYKTIRSDIWDGIGFLRFINTNLAVMNLLPIPVLDGGLILFSLIAIVFRRRIPEKFTAVVTTVFMYILIALMLFLVGRDFWRMGDLSKKVDLGELRQQSRESLGLDKDDENVSSATNGVSAVSVASNATATATGSAAPAQTNSVPPVKKEGVDVP